MPLSFDVPSSVPDVHTGSQITALGNQLATAESSRQRSLVLQALEQAYRNAEGDASKSQTEAAKKAGTYADTPEFKKGLADEAALQGRGTQSALLARIQALRSAEGLGAFDPSAPADVTPGAAMPDFLGFAPTASAETRAQLLRELETAYNDVPNAVSAGERAAAGSSYDPSNPDYVRGMQSNVYSGTTGANRQLQSRIDALRSSLGQEQFVDPRTSSQKYQSAGQAARDAAGAASAAEPASVDEGGEAAPAAGEEATTQSSTNAVTAAKKKTAPKVL